GPSGAGKNSLAVALLKGDPGLHRVVTATDRPRRPHETDGLDYHFLSREEFERLIAREELVEWATVYGQHKGIPKWELERALESGQDVLVLVDVQGAAAIRRLMPQAVSIFVAAPSEGEMIRRLSQRGGDTPQQVVARIATARQEMSHLEEFDYLVINHRGRLDEAVEQVEAILMAERCRIKR
ncbi:MAG: guanylate kinase, partial [Deltaproteobacteria bacterium]|nr:guanylate kinase [Deltaproteobacteria bacterium]